MRSWSRPDDNVLYWNRGGRTPVRVDRGRRPRAHVGDVFRRAVSEQVAHRVSWKPKATGEIQQVAKDGEPL